MKKRISLLVLLSVVSAQAGVTVVQNVAPGATSWPGAPLIVTMGNPSAAATPQCFTNGVAGFPTAGGNSVLSETFTITTTNYILQTIDIYAGGGSGTGAGTNIVLNLYDLGIQTAPNPTPYRWAGSYQDIIGLNQFGSGSGLGISYTSQTNGVLEFDFNGSDQVLLQAGHMYVFELAGTANRQPVAWLSVVNSNPYPGGAAYINQDWANFPSQSANEFAMAVYATATSNSPAAPSPLAGACTVNWTDVRQRIDGFGASSAFRQSGFSTAQLDLLFSTNTGVGLSLLRMMIHEGGTTAAAEIGIARQAIARGARVWSAPWSPQPSFKNPQLANGGNYTGIGTNATNLAYATQLANYVLSMKNQGIPLYALSIQNEPDFTNSTYDTCWWTAQQIHDFPTNLYNALVANNVASTRIMLPESLHWQSDTAIYTPAMNDPAVASVVGIIADHNYDNTPPSGTPAAIPSYGKALWETETAILSNPQNNGGITDSSMQNGIYWAGRIHAFLTVAQVNAWHHWWLISGNTTPNQGLTDINQNVLAKRGYVLGQFSRFVRPDFYRIGVVTNSGTATVSAYKDSNSSTFAIIAINANFTTAVNETFNLSNVVTTGSVTPWITSPALSLSSQPPVVVSGSSFTYTLPAMSVVTFVGQASNNIAPTLAPVTDQTINPGAILLVTNTATDPDLPPQILTFSLLNAPPGASLTALDATDALLTWRAPVSQADTTNPVVVQVMDNGTPGLAATNSFNIVVSPLAPTVLSSPDITDGRVTLTVDGTPGPDYTLSTSTNLIDWQVLFTTNPPALPFQFSDTNSTDVARFYRVQLGP